MEGRQGFALLFVLWIIAGMAAVSSAALILAREAVAVTKNQREITRLTWEAEGCVETLKAEIDRILSDRNLDGTESWDRLREEVRIVGEMPCQVDLIPTGSALSLKILDPEPLRRLLVLRGASPAGTDSMMAALGDWTDPDENTRPLGAETDWYRTAGRPGPSGQPLGAAAELLRIRGFEKDSFLVGLTTADSFPVSLRYAPAAVLRALPGIGREATEALLRRRSSPTPITLQRVLSGLTPLARDSLLEELPRLETLTTTRVEGWFVLARASSPVPGPSVALEVLLLRAGRRAVVRRRRMWME